MSFRICGTGSALPEKIVTNGDLMKIFDTSDEWISSRTGISSRRIISEPGRGLLELGTEAGCKALDNAGMTAADIDMVICATLHGDYITPSMSCLIVKNMSLNIDYLMDINMACSGFIYALDAADSYIKAGKVKNVLIICAEAISRLLDWSDRSTGVLFGDAAAAAVVTACDNFTDLKLSSNGNISAIYIDRVTDNCPFAPESDKITKSCLHMNGQETYKFAVNAIYNDIVEMLEKHDKTPDDIKYFLLHQANIRIITSAMTKLKQPEEKYPCNIGKYGNTSSATIPLLLDEMNRETKLNRGDNIILSAFGAGLTTGICFLKW